MNLVLLKVGIWGTSLPHQVFTAFQGAVAEPGKNFSSSTCSQWGLAVLEQWLWLHSVEMEESPGTRSSDHQLSLVPRWPWCPQAALGPWSQPWSAAAGAFGNTCQGELVLVLLKAEKTKAYQCHLGGERPLYCPIWHAELQFQFKWTFWTKQIAFGWETWFRIAWSLNSFTWDIKAQLKFLEAHQCIHSSASFQQGVEEGKDSISEEPFPSLSLALPMLQNLCLLFCIYLSYFRGRAMVTSTGAAPAESASLQRDIGSTSHLPDLCKIQFF